jgi:type IV pilus assembly protein PilA
MRNRNQKGFTLIELLIVIAIIGILAAVLIPNLTAARTRAFDTETQSCGRAIATAQEVYFIDYRAYAADEDDLKDIEVCDANVTITTGAYDGAGWGLSHSVDNTKKYIVSTSGLVEDKD